MHLPFTPNHVLLVAACYPDSAALLTAGPDFRPNSQELSRLTYYAANRPGKITKLSVELEKRVRIESRKAKDRNQRSRASLLVTLAIFKALVVDCRQEISLLSASLVASVEVTLNLLSADLEVAARAASLFTAWATYTDGHLIGVDTRVTETYMSVLRIFGRMSCVESTSSDQETRNRTRLIGLGAISGVVASEALYGASSQLRAQADVILDSILATVQFSSIQDLDDIATEMRAAPGSPRVSESRARPLADRRAMSIYAHIDGQQGPSHNDVVEACLRALSSLLAQANGGQIGYVMQSTFESLDNRSGWEKPEHCAWLAQKIADWTQYQYRYAVPTLLVERLLETQDVATTTPSQQALTKMITTVFTSPAPLVNLSTSDIISNLITLVLRRVSINPSDDLLASLVGCIASLGTHVYYADQIRDLAGELVSRLLVIEANGVPGKQRGDDGGSRSQALRCLLIGLVGLMQAADKHTYTHEAVVNNDTIKVDENGKPILPHVATEALHPRPSRRAKVPSEIWQDTLTLLCDGDYAVRADYAAALIAFLNTEISKDGEETDGDGVRRIRPLASSPTRQASNISAALWGDPVTRCLNGVHAYLYMLAVSETLGHNQGRRPSSSGRSIAGDTPAPSVAHGDESVNGHVTVEAPPSSSVPTRARKVSMGHRMLQHIPRELGSSAAASASDYGHILAILSTLHQQLPVRGLLTGIPMLLALDAATKVNGVTEAESGQRVRTMKEVLARVWLAIGHVWECPEVSQLATKALATLTSPTTIPELQRLEAGLYHSPQEAVDFSSEPLPSHEALEMNVEGAVLAIASCQAVQDATGLDQEALLARLTRPWSAESALRESVEADPGIHRNEGTATVLKIAPALMHIENLSLASLNRPMRGVGVTDLREALSGRSSMSNSALVTKPPSVSTLDRTSAVLPDGHPLTLVRTRTHQKKKLAAGPNEVRDVLNKLGIGKQNGNGQLRTPFNASQPADRKISGSFVPPYRS